MDLETARSAWGEDARTLAEIGGHLAGQPTRITVRLPAGLARVAPESWERDDFIGQAAPETPAQAVRRRRSGSLALIGQAIDAGGRVEGTSVVVDLDAWQIGDALNAADEAGLLNDPPKG